MCGDFDESSEFTRLRHGTGTSIAAASCVKKTMDRIIGYSLDLKQSRFFRRVTGRM